MAPASSWSPRVAILVFLACVPAAVAEPAPTDERFKELIAAAPRFEVYVFPGPQFPACRFEPPGNAAFAFGPFALRTTFYDRDGQPVKEADRPGPYAAMVEIGRRAGPPLRRYVTLFRTARDVDPDWRFRAEAAAELAQRAGLPSAIVAGEAKLIDEQLKGRPFAEWSRDARAARLLTGLSVAPELGGPARKNADAFAQERQWWVTLKGRVGPGREPPRPFDGPRVLDGPAAPVLRDGTAEEAGMKPDAAAKIDAVCRAWAADDDQAFAVCVARHGVIVLHQAYGERDGRPMTRKTKSWMASVTKTLSASLLWMLVDQGLVGLDDPVAKYLPALKGTEVETPLTVRHLYTHTNGLENWPGWDDELPDVAERVADYYPRLQVGKAWAYNGTGYTLGGKVIEAVTGEAVPLCFQRHLLDPLGLADTDVLGTHVDAYSTPLDMARFGQLLLNRGRYGRLRFFRAETFEQMLPEKLTRVLGTESAKTFGIGLDGRRDHFGHGAASGATFSVSRADDLVVVMTRNRSGKNQGKYHGKFWQAIKDGLE